MPVLIYFHTDLLLPALYPQLDVICGDSMVEVTFTNYRTLDPASLYVGDSTDPACEGTVSEDTVTFSAPLDACGVGVTVSTSVTEI